MSDDEPSVWPLSDEMRAKIAAAELLQHEYLASPEHPTYLAGGVITPVDPGGYWYTAPIGRPGPLRRMWLRLTRRWQLRRWADVGATKTDL
ncbi:MAG: hypothetical protein JWR88_1049 [Pseudonocardia sp.]|nr:hypothetical protein [Pseudonocardia sp.]